MISFSDLLKPIPGDDPELPTRGPSDIIFRWDLNDAMVQGICYTDGDAAYENDASMLDTHCADIAGDNAKTGWYVIEGFTMTYTKDYYGEVDGDADYKTFRRATFKDFNAIWYGGKGDLFLQIAAKLKLPMPAWWPEP